MSQFVTLVRTQPEFLSYLEGKFSKTARALPIKSLNVNTDQEKVTFEIVPVREISKPHFLAMLFKVLRVPSWLMVLVPILFIQSSFVGWQNAHWLIAFTSALGALCLFVGVNLRSDYSDHMRGIDRIQLSSSSRAIQQGWIPAYQIKNTSNILLVLGALLGVPAIMNAPQILLLGVVMALIIWLFSSQAVGLKYNGGGELAAILLMGPLLTIGYAWAVSIPITWLIVLAGVIFGCLASLILHLKNFQQIMVSSQAGVKNIINILGFDRAKNFIVIWVILSILFPVIFNFLQAHWTALWVLLAAQVSIAYFILVKLMQLKSCIGSELQEISRLGLIFYNITMIWWLIGSNL